MAKSVENADKKSISLNDKVDSLSGIGVKKRETLKKLGLYEIGDFLYFFPREYQDRRKLYPIEEVPIGETVRIQGEVVLIIPSANPYAKKKPLRLLVKDQSGSLEIVFFNGTYLTKQFFSGGIYDFYGKVQADRGKLQMMHPEFQPVGKGYTSGILPVYPLTAGITQGEMRNWQRQAGLCLDQIPEYLPEELMKKHRLCDIAYALENIHFPEDGNKLKAAKYRLVFEELLILQTALLGVKMGIKQKKKQIKTSPEVLESEYIKTLPYNLTEAQNRVVKEIMADLESETSMNRLVQGDVGSGKTAVAEVALYKVCKSGYQGVLMAPTEILARQHYQGLKERFVLHGLEVGFLAGSLSQKEKKQVLGQLKDGSLQILVGTHAIIQQDVEFSNLGLVITDEQHRFGVNQRAMLTKKGGNPEVLVMTATPIPRTLAVVLYGDLDISVLDQLPPGRQKIITKALTAKGRNKVYESVKGQLAKGRQAYVVTPLIEDSELLEARSAESVYEELKSLLQPYKVALLHGEMKQKDKDSVMEEFYRGEIQVLVSTVVIEVGVNVPNATVMVVENAERFGLAQLHQLRGRVGRGREQSYCMLITEGQSQVAQDRAKILENSGDGFYIAEEDLKLRGPGEFFGTKQHGIPQLQIADLVKHLSILEVVKDEAKELLSVDPELKNPENAGIRKKIEERWQHYTAGG